MELFREDGCLTDEGLLAVTKGGLDELGRLETAEHLSYCDRCMDRYTALLRMHWKRRQSRCAGP